MALGSGGNELRLDVAVNARDAILAANALAQQLQALAGSAQGAGAATAQMAQAAERQSGGIKAWAKDWGLVALGFNQFLTIGRQVIGTITGIAEAMDRRADMMAAAHVDIGRLVAATHNLVSTNDLLAASNRLMSDEFNIGQAAMERYARAAWILSERSGRSWQEAMDGIATALMGSTRGLRQFGIQATDAADAARQLERVAAGSEVGAGSLADALGQINNAAKDAAAGGLMAIASGLSEVWQSIHHGQAPLTGLLESLRAIAASGGALGRIAQLRQEIADLEAAQQPLTGLSQYSPVQILAKWLEAAPQGEQAAGVIRGMRLELEQLEKELARGQALAEANAGRAWLEIGPQGRARQPSRAGGARVARGSRGAGTGGGVPFGPQTEEEFLTGLSAGLAPESALESLMDQAVSSQVDDLLALGDASRAAGDGFKQMFEDLGGGAAIAEVATAAFGGLFNAIVAGEGSIGKLVAKAAGMALWSAGIRTWGEAMATLAKALGWSWWPGGQVVAAGGYAVAAKQFAMATVLMGAGAAVGHAGGAFGSSGGGGGGGSSRSPGVGTGGGGGNEEPQRSVVINIMPGAVVTGDAGDVGEALYNLLGEGVRRRRVQTTEAGGRAVLAFR